MKYAYYNAQSRIEIVIPDLTNEVIQKFKKKVLCFRILKNAFIV